MEMLTFEKCFKDVTGGNKKIKQSDYLEKGLIPIIDQGKKLIGGYTNDKSTIIKAKLPCIVYGDHSRNIKYFDKDFALGADGVKLLETSKELIPKYGYYFLNSVKLPETGYDRSFKYLKKINVPVPDLETQNKIVAILDKAKSIFEKRERTIAMYDELLRATFLDMFGDPVENNKFWETDDLKNLAKLERGRFSPRPRNDPSYFDGIYPYIQTGEIANSNYRLTKYTQTLNEKGIAVSKEFKIGTIVIAIVGATIGATAIIEIDAYATDSIIGVKPKKEINNIFLEMLLRFQKKVLVDNAPEAARANINLAIIGKIKIIKPSIELQNKYAKVSNFIYENKEKLNKAKTKTENLLNAISQLAFKGALAVNKKNTKN